MCACAVCVFHLIRAGFIITDITIIFIVKMCSAYRWAVTCVCVHGCDLRALFYVCDAYRLICLFYRA